MANKNETKVNKLVNVHVDKDGIVWQASSGHMPLPTLQKVPDYIPAVDNIVQALGCHCNVQLLNFLYELQQINTTTNTYKINICTPSACSTAERRLKPEIVLMDMRQWKGWPASMGGWHEFTDLDYSAYKLAEHYMFVDGQKQIDDILFVGEHNELKAELLAHHPSFRALSFIDNLDEDKLCRLLALILDPRWYIDLEKPEKLSRLEGFLGLSPKTQFNVSGKGNDKKVQNQYRCKLVMDVWKTKAPPSKDLAQPGNFLWRIRKKEGNGYMGDLRASQTFISFLRSVWLDEIYKGRGGAGCDGLFVPEYFFSDQEDATGFKEHMKRCTVGI